jgi:hypothetical protein
MSVSLIADIILYWPHKLPLSYGFAHAQCAKVKDFMSLMLRLIEYGRSGQQRVLLHHN